MNTILNIIILPFWIFFELTGLPIIPACLDPDYREATRKKERETL